MSSRNPPPFSFVNTPVIDPSEITAKAQITVRACSTCEAPWLILERLHILNLNQQDIAGLGAGNIKGSGKIMNLGQVDIFDVVGRVVVLDLASGPVHTFNLHET